jgi:hypothetical protein
MVKDLDVGGKLKISKIWSFWLNIASILSLNKNMIYFRDTNKNIEFTNDY